MTDNTTEIREETQGGAEEKAPKKSKNAKALEEAQAKITALEEELAAERDKYLRMLAEYDNFRRRSAKERQSVWSDAVCETVKSILPICDNMERALAATGDDASIRQGLTMIAASLAETLTKMGVEVYGEVGEEFDPNIHNAVMHVEDETLGQGVIAEVFQRGHRLGDKIIRYAMVKVAN
ncbi:MAG: nucleotide exchange factor GrpE [Clostridia bacterium]|nr:nucleotide exchange factor GrpE [Clostridia bacterium]